MTGGYGNTRSFSFLPPSPCRASFFISHFQDCLQTNTGAQHTTMILSMKREHGVEFLFPFAADVHKDTDRKEASGGLSWAPVFVVESGYSSAPFPPYRPSSVFPQRPRGPLPPNRRRLVPLAPSWVAPKRPALSGPPLACLGLLRVGVLTCQSPRRRVSEDRDCGGEGGRQVEEAGFQRTRGKREERRERESKCFFLFLRPPTACPLSVLHGIQSRMINFVVFIALTRTGSSLLASEALLSRQTALLIAGMQFGEERRESDCDERWNSRPFCRLIFIGK